MTFGASFPWALYKQREMPSTWHVLPLRAGPLQLPHELRALPEPPTLLPTEQFMLLLSIKVQEKKVPTSAVEHSPEHHTSDHRKESSL